MSKSYGYFFLSNDGKGEPNPRIVMEDNLTGADPGLYLGGDAPLTYDVAG